MTEPGELNKPLLKAADGAPPSSPRPPPAPAAPVAPTQPTAAPAPATVRYLCRPERGASAFVVPAAARRTTPHARPGRPALLRATARASGSRPTPLAPGPGDRGRHRDGAGRRGAARQRQPQRVAVLQRQQHLGTEQHGHQSVGRVVGQRSRRRCRQLGFGRSRCSPVSSTSPPRSPAAPVREPVPAC